MVEQFHGKEKVSSSNPLLGTTTMQKFYINPDFLTDVRVTEKTRFSLAVAWEISRVPPELRDMFDGREVEVSKSVDHPEFAKLRNLLESKGLIETQRNWWNGDRVLKYFVLNGKIFHPDEQFPCAAAMRGNIETYHRKFRLAVVN